MKIGVFHVGHEEGQLLDRLLVALSDSLFDPPWRRRGVVVEDLEELVD